MHQVGFEGGDSGEAQLETRVLVAADGLHSVLNLPVASREHGPNRGEAGVA